MPPVRPVGGRVRRVMVGSAGRPLDDGVAGTWRTVVTTLLTAMVPARADGLEVLSFVATADATPQVVSTSAATAATPAAQEVRAGGAATPLQLLQLGSVVLRAAGHASAGDRHLPGHTCVGQTERAKVTLLGRTPVLPAEKGFPSSEFSMTEEESEFPSEDLNVSWNFLERFCRFLRTSPKMRESWKAKRSRTFFSLESFAGVFAPFNSGHARDFARYPI